MANVDITLKITNMTLYNQLRDWINKPQTLNVSLGNASQLLGQLKQVVGSPNIKVLPTLGNVNQLKSQIRQSIGGTSVPISPHLANVNQLRNQIRQTVNNTPVRVSPTLGNPAQLTNLIRQTLNSAHFTITPAIANANQIRSQIRQAISNPPIAMPITVANAHGLRGQIRTAIGNIPIQVSIANLAALNNQIAQIFANAGIQVGNYNTPPQGGATGQRIARSLGRILASQIRQEDNPIDPRLGNVENTLGVLSGQPGVQGIYNEQALRGIDRSRQAVARKHAKYNRKFAEERLFETAILGRDQAATEFEEEQGLRAGTIDRNGPRFSFNLSRTFNTRAARNELGFAALYGGIPGALGGLAGGGAFGAGGVFLGSAMFQKGLEFFTDTLHKIWDAFLKVTGAGLEFQKEILGISAAFQSSSKIVRGGKEVSPAEAVTIQNQRARDLVSKAQPELSKIGLGTSQQAALLRGVTVGLSEGGFNANSEQILKLSKIIGGTTIATNEDLLQSIPRFVNDVSDLISSAPGSQRSELGLSFRRIIPEIKEAQTSGDVDKLIVAFEKFKGILNTLENSSDNAVIAFRKLQSSFESSTIVFSDAFTKAIIPSISHLGEVLGRPEVKEGLVTLGQTLGNFADQVIDLGARIAESINPQNIHDLSNAFLELGESISKTLLGPQATKALKASGFFKGSEELQRQNDINLTNQKMENVLNARKAQLGQSKISTGTSSGTGAFRGTDYQVESADPDAAEKKSLKKRLTEIDQSTPQGAYQASVVKNRLAQLNENGFNSENLSKDVLKAQAARNEKVFKLQEEQRNTFTGNIAGQANSSILGLSIQEAQGQIGSQNAQAQKTQILLKAQEDMVTSFYSLQAAVNDSANAMKEQAMRAKELSLQLIDIKAQQAGLVDAQKLNSLSGLDKLLELKNQVEKGGGIVDIDTQRKIEYAAQAQGVDLAHGGFGNLTTPEERKQAILEQQLKTEANNFSRQGNLNRLQGVSLESQKNKLEIEQKNAPLKAKLEEANQYRSILSFAQEFTPEKANEIFGREEGSVVPKDKVKEALEFFGKESINNLGAKGSKSPTEALERIFGSKDYYRGVQESFTASLRDVFNGS